MFLTLYAMGWGQIDEKENLCREWIHLNIEKEKLRRMYSGREDMKQKKRKYIKMNITLLFCASCFTREGMAFLFVYY